MFRTLALAFALLTFTFPAQAKLLFAPSLTHLEQSEKISTTETKSKLTVIDVRLGYVLDFGLYLGGLYSVQNNNLNVDSSDSYLGPSIGYFNSGFLVVGTYYIYGEKDLGDGSGKYSKVSGFQLDFSYTLPVAENVSIGPQLTYKSFEFDEIEVNGFAQPSEYSYSGLTPYFTLNVFFE